MRSSHLQSLPGGKLIRDKVPGLKEGLKEGIEQEPGVIGVSCHPRLKTLSRFAIGLEKYLQGSGTRQILFPSVWSTLTFASLGAFFRREHETVE